MTLWRIHVVVTDRPGRLGEIAVAVGRTGANIVSLHVVGEPSDDGSVVDELLVDLPKGLPVPAVVEQLEAVEAEVELVARADAAELSDQVTTALALARVVVADPGSASRAVAALLRAEIVPPDPPGRDTAAADAVANGFQHPIPSPARPPGSGPAAAGSNGRGWSPPHRCDVVGGRLRVHLGRAWPFTATEVARGTALLELATQLAGGGGRPAPPTMGRALLSDGSEVELRIATPADAPLVAALHARSTPESRRLRFLSSTPKLGPDALRDLVSMDAEHAAVLAMTVDGGHAVGLGNLSPCGPGCAELALLVEDAWQGRGLGTALLRRLVELARDRQLEALSATAHVGHHRLTRLLRRAGLRPQAWIEDGLLQVRADLGKLHAGL